MSVPVMTVIIAAKYCETAQTTQYTSTGATTKVDMFTATNVSASSVTFSVHIVESGDSASAANKIVSSQEVLPGAAYIADEMCHNINPGAFISTTCSASNSLVIYASGREVAA